MLIIRVELWLLVRLIYRLYVVVASYGQSSWRNQSRWTGNCKIEEVFKSQPILDNNRVIYYFYHPYIQIAMNELPKIIYIL